MVAITMVSYYDAHWYRIELPGRDVDYFPSVTTKLGIVNKPFLAKWRGDIGNREADYQMWEAQERGKRLHYAWLVLSTGGAVVYQPDGPGQPDHLAPLRSEYRGNVYAIRQQEEMWQVYKLQKWVEAVKPKFLFSEKTLYSLQHREAGTMDSLVAIQAGDYSVNGSKTLTIKAGAYVLDLKTGNMVGNDAYRQTAAYAAMVEEMGLLKPLGYKEVAGTIVLHTGSKNVRGIEGLSTLVRTRVEVQQDYNAFRVVSDLWEIENKDARPRVYEFPTIITLKKEGANATAA